MDTNGRWYRVGLQLRLFNDMPTHHRHLSQCGFYWDCVKRILQDLKKELAQARTRCLALVSDSASRPGISGSDPLSLTLVESQSLTEASPPDACPSESICVFFTTDTESMRARALSELSADLATVVFADVPLVHTSKISQSTMNQALLDWCVCNLLRATCAHG